VVDAGDHANTGPGARPIRLLLLITGLGLGGAEKAIATLATGLPRDRYTVRVACLLDPGPYAARIERTGIPVHALGLRRVWDTPLALFRLRRLLAEYKIDVLHAFLFHANLLGRFAGWFAGTPVRISGVRVCEVRRRHLLLDRWTQGLVHAETCVSENVLRFTRDQARITESKLVAIPNGVLLPAPDPETRGHVRAAERVPPDVPVLLCLGRLDPQKAPLDLVAAAVALGPRPFRLWLAGGGPEEAAVRAAIARAGVGERVRLLGVREDVGDLLSAADVLALSSRWEGLPNAVLEAMAAGLPVVATNVGGTPELVVEGETGYLVPPADPGAMAERLSRLLDDAGLRRRMGAAARARVAAEFTVERFVARHEALYERLAREHGAAGRR